jgi:hypothetical protein
MITYFGQCVTHKVVSLLEIFNCATRRELVCIITVMNDNESQVKSVTQIKQMISLSTSPGGRLKFLQILGVCISWD